MMLSQTHHYECHKPLYQFYIINKFMIFLPLFFFFFAVQVHSIEKQCVWTRGLSTNLSTQDHPENNQTTLLRQIFGIGIGQDTERVDVCPGHSYCNEKGYCSCNNGYILGCETLSNTLTSKIQQFTFSQNIKQYFSILPHLHQRKSFFQFHICFDGLNQKQKSAASSDSMPYREKIIDNDALLFDIRVYGDVGADEQINEEMKILNTTLLTNGAKDDDLCSLPTTLPLDFGQKINGETEQLILTIELMTHEQFIELYAKNIGNNSQIDNNGSRRALQNSQAVQAQLKLAVYQISFYAPKQLYYANLLTICLLVFSGILSVSTIVLFKYRHHRFPLIRHRRMKNCDISHFNKYIPKYTLNEESLEIRMQETCAICLLEFKDGDIVRKTDCGHPYHSQCLDQWCKTLLQCPLCRKCLKKTSMSKSMIKQTLQRIDEQNPESLDIHEPHNASQMKI